MIVVEIVLYRAVFYFDGGFFASKKGKFRDGSVWDIIDGFEWLDGFGIVQVQLIYGHAINDNSVVWLVYFNSFESFTPINGAELLCLFFCFASDAYIISESIDSL